MEKAYWITQTETSSLFSNIFFILHFALKARFDCLRLMVLISLLKRRYGAPIMSPESRKQGQMHTYMCKYIYIYIIMINVIKIHLPETSSIRLDNTFNILIPKY